MLADEVATTTTDLQPSTVTTAYRSKLRLEEQGWDAAVVETRHGKFRMDLFKTFDVLAFHRHHGILMVQAYEHKAWKGHAHLTAEHSVIKAWLDAGGLFCHHVWHRPRKKLPKWTLETRWIGAQKPDEVH